MRRWLAICTLLFGCVTPHGDSRRTPPSPEIVARHTLASTFVIRVRLAGGGAKGSAWVISPGIAVTAKHVTDGGQSFELRSRGGKQCTVTWVEEHPTKDISLVGYEGCEDVAPIPLRVSKVTEGTRAYVAGNPLFIDWTFTQGIVSDADEPKFIYLDAVAEPGNSGGPVVDEEGRVFGMAVRIVGDPLAHTWGGMTLCVRLKDIVAFLTQTMVLKSV